MDQHQYHFFYSERPPERSPLTNFYRTRYTIYDHSFSYSEQGFMYGKAILFGDHEIAEQILQTKTPREAKDLGRRVRGFDNKVWEANRERIMFENCLAKFGTNKKLGKYLLKTGNKRLVEASPRDRIWGIGYSMKKAPHTSPELWGLNLLGKVLERVRTELRSRE